MELRFFRTQAQWRGWLERHHATKDELVVGFYKKGTGKPSITWPESVDEALCFGWIDGVRRRVDEESYSIRFTPRRQGSIWSAVNIRRMKFLEEHGLVHEAGRAAFSKKKAEKAGIYAYENRHKAKFTPAMQRRFRQNARAWAFFRGQAPWYQRNATWYVISAKREETREKRLATLIAKSAAGRSLDHMMRIKQVAALLLALFAVACGGEGARTATPPAPDSFQVAMETSRGPVQIMVHRDWAPIGADRLYYLVQNHFYDDARFFRVVKGFVVQFGLPADPALSERYVKTPLADDPVKHHNARGTIAYAHAGPGTRTSQLFVNLKDNAVLDAQGFAVLGEVREGMNVLDSLDGEYDGPDGPQQHFIETMGNAYLTSSFPRLDYIKTARIR